MYPYIYMFIFIIITCPSLSAKAILDFDAYAVSLEESSAIQLPIKADSISVEPQIEDPGPLVSYKRPKTLNGAFEERSKNTDASSAAEYTVDMERNPNYVGPIDNTRFTNVYNLEDIVEYILSFKHQNPESKPWAVFDVDEMLLLRSGEDSLQINPRTEVLFNQLKDAQIPIVLLSMGGDPKEKFKKAGLTYDGLIHDALYDLNTMGLEKGLSLYSYLIGKQSEQRPDHIFFSDDTADFLHSVESHMKQAGLPFTTFHFHGWNILMGKIFRLNNTANSVVEVKNMFPAYFEREARRRKLSLDEYLQRFEVSSP